MDALYGSDEDKYGWMTNSFEWHIHIIKYIIGFHFGKREKERVGRYGAGRRSA